MQRPDARQRLIFALDVPTLAEAENLVGELRDEVGVFKIGLEFCLAEGSLGVERVLRLIGGRAKAFLDLKIGDIPRTAKGSVSHSLLRQVDFATVRLNEGRAVVKAVLQAAGDTKVLGVTLLTSLDESDLRDMGISATPGEAVLRMASSAQDLGCSGVICSAHEARAVKERCGKDFLVITPGIRPEGRPAAGEVAGDDQRRVATPRSAISEGADYIVVGRPIRLARDRRAAAREIVEEIRGALS